MPSTSDARKAARTTYKHKPTQSELPDGYTLDSRMSGIRAQTKTRRDNCQPWYTRDSRQMDRFRGCDWWQEETELTRTSCDKMCTSRLQITAVGHSLGGTLAQDTKGPDKQIAFNKATTLHGILYKWRPGLPQEGMSFLC
jgi:hypothetical protein